MVTFVEGFLRVKAGSAVVSFSAFVRLNCSAVLLHEVRLYFRCGAWALDFAEWGILFHILALCFVVPRYRSTLKRKQDFYKM